MITIIRFIYYDLAHTPLSSNNDKHCISTRLLLYSNKSLYVFICVLTSINLRDNAVEYTWEINGKWMFLAVTKFCNSDSLMLHPIRPIAKSKSKPLLH